VGLYLILIEKKALRPVVLQLDVLFEGEASILIVLFNLVNRYYHVSKFGGLKWSYKHYSLRYYVFARWRDVGIVLNGGI